MLMEMENLLFLMDRYSGFYRLQLKKSGGDCQNFSFFQSGDGSSVEFSNGDKISWCFLAERLGYTVYIKNYQREYQTLRKIIDQNIGKTVLGRVFIKINVSGAKFYWLLNNG